MTLNKAFSKSHGWWGWHKYGTQGNQIQIQKVSIPLRTNCCPSYSGRAHGINMPFDGWGGFVYPRCGAILGYQGWVLLLWASWTLSSDSSQANLERRDLYYWVQARFPSLAPLPLCAWTHWAGLEEAEWEYPIWRHPQQGGTSSGHSHRTKTLSHCDAKRYIHPCMYLFPRTCYKSSNH